MSDHLLRLAKLTLRLAGDVLSEMSPEGRNLHAALSDLVRDLEAAESMRLRLADCSENEAPAPERRTITREEWQRVFAIVRSVEEVNNIAAAWRLTVEDA